MFICLVDITQTHARIHINSYIISPHDKIISYFQMRRSSERSQDGCSQNIALRLLAPNPYGAARPDSSWAWIERPQNGTEHQYTQTNDMSWVIVPRIPPCDLPQQMKSPFRCARGQTWASTWYDVIDDDQIGFTIPGSNNQLHSPRATCVLGPPRNVVIQGISNGQVHLQWQPPQSAETVDSYIVTVNNFFRCDTPQGQAHRFSQETLAAAIPIIDNTSYIFSVQAVSGEGESQVRKLALVLRKHKILDMHMDNIFPADIPIVAVPLEDKTVIGRDILIKEPKVTISQIPSDEETLILLDTNAESGSQLDSAGGRHTSLSVRQRTGQPTNSEKECIVLLLGYKDSGTLLFIDDLMNYNLGVIYRDNFRFKLVDANSSKAGTCEEMLRTTIYTLPYQHGLEKRRIKLCALPDLDITTKNPKAFQDHLKKCCDRRYGVDHVNAIAFVTTSNGPPLNKDVLQMLNAMFGPEVKNNMVTIITDSDKRRPRVVTNEAMADYDYFCFNNSVMFGPERDEWKPIWNASMMNFEALFRKLHGMCTMLMVPNKDIIWRTRLRNVFVRKTACVT